MDIERLAKECYELFKQEGSQAVVVVEIPRRARGQRVRLMQRRGPCGEVLEAGEGYTVARFKAWEVLRFLWRNFL